MAFTRDPFRDRICRIRKFFKYFLVLPVVTKGRYEILQLLHAVRFLDLR